MIYKTVKDKNYTVIDNEYLKDNKLSFGAIGLMTVLLSFKEDTRFNKELISKVSGKSIKVITKYLNELKKNKYVIIKRNTTKNGYTYDYYIYESNKFNPNYKNDSPYTQNQTLGCQRIGKDSVIINTNNKQDKIIDKTKLNLCHLTYFIIDKGLINVNDINLFAYDAFLNKLLSKEDYKKVIRSVTYTTNHIINNNFKDESESSIINLFVYFKSSVISNINRQYSNEEEKEYNFD